MTVGTCPLSSVPTCLGPGRPREPQRSVETLQEEESRPGGGSTALSILVSTVVVLCTLEIQLGLCTEY